MLEDLEAQVNHLFSDGEWGSVTKIRASVGVEAEVSTGTRKEGRCREKTETEESVWIAQEDPGMGERLGIGIDWTKSSKSRVTHFSRPGLLNEKMVSVKEALLLALADPVGVWNSMIEL